MGRKTDAIKNITPSDNELDFLHAEQDEALSALIKGLNNFITIASSHRMGTAVRILCSAKEELVLWAVNMDFNENDQERFITKNLYDNGSCIVGEFIQRIRKIEDKQLRNKILQQLGFLEN